jgi:hypothetical protein
VEKSDGGMEEAMHADDSTSIPGARAALGLHQDAHACDMGGRSGNERRGKSAGTPDLFPRLSGSVEGSRMPMKVSRDGRIRRERDEKGLVTPTDSQDTSL